MTDSDIMNILTHIFGVILGGELCVCIYLKYYQLGLHSECINLNLYFYA